MIQRHLRPNKLKIILYCLTLTLIWFLYTKGDILKIRLQDDRISEASKCPACYGTNLCHFIDTGDIHVTGPHSWRLSQLINVKNVFHGFWTSRNTSVVIKKLGYDSELELLDRRLCKAASEEAGCHPGEAITRLAHQVGKDCSNQSCKTFGLAELQNLLGDGESPDMLRCADQNLVNFITEESLQHPSEPSLENILTMLMINQEPVIAMAFPSRKLFPFPEYLGACGRLAVFADAGPSLTDLSPVSPWIVRSAISYELFQQTSFLTKTNLNLAFYPTDWSPDHFSVDKTTSTVNLVDLENIIIVNLTNTKDLPMHKSDNYGCGEGECFSFSVSDLCQHSSSDHNLFGLCSNILSPSPFSINLLREPSSRVESKYRSFPGLLDTCWRGGLKQRKDARIKAGRNIEKILLEELELEEFPIY